MNETQKRRKRGNRLHMPVAALLITFIAVFGAAVFFRVTRIEVRGGARYSPDDVLAHAKIKNGDNLLLYDARAAEKRIDAALPYIGSVKVTRTLPGTVVIEVTERSASAAFIYDGAYWLIDKDARLLETLTVSPSNIAILSGVLPRTPEPGKTLTIDADAAGSRRSAVVAVLTALVDNGLMPKVSTIDMTNISSITFAYDGRMSVNLGTQTDADTKIQRFVRKLGEIGENFHGSVDLTGDAVRVYE